MTQECDGDIGSLLNVDVVANGRAICVRLIGELDLSTVQQLRDCLGHHDLNDRLPVLVDVSELTFCDARGLTELLGLYQRLRRSGRTVAFLGASSALRRLMRITGADLVVDLW
jgi:anti-sigma B factor antagonist